jgi:hypothetical protein
LRSHCNGGSSSIGIEKHGKAKRPAIIQHNEWAIFFINLVTKKTRAQTSHLVRILALCKMPDENILAIKGPPNTRGKKMPILYMYGKP